MRKVSLILIVCFTFNIYSQIPIDFFPYKTGNIWKYYCYSWLFSDAQYVQSTIILDSTDINGIIYSTRNTHCLEQGGPPPGYVNLFSTCNFIIIDSNYVYSDRDPFSTLGNENEYYLKYKLDAYLGEIWIVHQDSISPSYFEFTIGKIINIDTISYFGSSIISKEILYYSTTDTSDTSTSDRRFSEIIASGIGSIQYESAYLFWTGYNLEGAIINGQVIGDTTGVITQVGLSKNMIKHFNLYQNYPNPFNSSTTIKYNLQRASQVKIRIYDISGKLVKELLNTIQLRGSYHIIWDGRDLNNHEVSSGFYYIIISSESQQQSRRMLKIK